MLKKMLFTGIMLFICISFLSAQTAEAPSAGYGYSYNPYQVATLANLRWLSENSDKWASGIYFIQTADIDASENRYWNSEAGFSPIGNQNTPFQGNYNRAGYTISGLYINRPLSDNIGFFGYIISGVKISQLGLLDVELYGGRYVGSLAGINRGIISNCYASGSVSGSRNTGGLIGFSTSDSKVLNCYAKVSIIRSEVNASPFPISSPASTK